MKAIAAVSKNYGIGKGGKLLFSIPDDMDFFKKTTTGNVVVMGRKTFESLPGKKILPNRVNVILTHDQNYFAEGALIISSIDELLEIEKNTFGKDVYVIGGGRVYDELMPYIDDFLITKVDSYANADVFLENLDKNDSFILVSESEEKEFEGIKYKFCRYKRK